MKKILIVILALLSYYKMVAQPAYHIAYSIEYDIHDHDTFGSDEKCYDNPNIDETVSLVPGNAPVTKKIPLKCCDDEVYVEVTLIFFMDNQRNISVQMVLDLWEGDDCKEEHEAGKDYPSEMVSRNTRANIFNNKRLDDDQGDWVKIVKITVNNTAP